MRKLILLIILASSCWGAVCTSRQNGSWNDKATWGSGSGCAGAHAMCSDGTSPCPGLGDTATVNHAVVQNVPGLVIGVNGALPQYSYLQTLTGGGGSGYTSCSATLSGGTPITYTRAGSVGCDIVNGAVTPYIIDRGWYSTCPTVTVAGVGGTGGTFPGTLSCPIGGGGTPAIVNNGVLTIAANTYVRGTLDLEAPVRNVPVSLIINPGANLFMDMTQAPAGTIYGITNGGDGVTISADCTAAQCSIQGVGGVTIIDYFSTGDRTLIMLAKNVLFKNVGDASTVAMRTGDSWDGSAVQPASVYNSIFDTCGTVWLVIHNMGITWSGNTHKNTPVHYAGDTGMKNIYTASDPVYAPGVRTLTNNSFDALVGMELRSFTITGNVFTGGFNAQSSDTTHWDLFQDNFWRWPNAGYLYDGLRMQVAGSIHNTYFLVDTMKLQNPHYLTGTPDNTTMSNNIFTLSGRVTGTGKWLAGGASGSTYTVNNNIQLCGGSGLDSGNFSNPFSGSGYTYLYTHNTYCSTGNSMLYGNESAYNPAGFLTLKSNLIYTPAPAIRMMIWTTGTYGYPPTQDICTTTSATVSNCDYNGVYVNPIPSPWTQSYCPGCTNQGRGYSGLWSYTPGYHDIDGQNPQFVDVTRRLENFDHKYLRKALEPEWVAGTTYAYDSRVSNSDATEYGGEVFNFRCTNPSGCTSAEAPGTGSRSAAGTLTSASVDITSLNMNAVYPQHLNCVANGGDAVAIDSFSTTGSAPIKSVTMNYTSTAGVTCYVSSDWRFSWEWASLYWLRELAYQKAHYTDGAIGCARCSVVQALNAWVRAGFVPLNPRFWGAGHDGKDIGAVHLPAVRRVFAVTVAP